MRYQEADFSDIKDKRTKVANMNYDFPNHTGPHGQLLKSLFLGAGVLRQDQRSVSVWQRRSQTCVIFKHLASCGFLAGILKYRPVWREHCPAARKPGSPDAKHPVKSNNGAPTLGRHLGRGGGEIQLRKKKGEKSLCFLVLQQTNVPKDQDGLLCSLDLG